MLLIMLSTCFYKLTVSSIGCDYSQYNLSVISVRVRRIYVSDI